MGREPWRRSPMISFAVALAVTALACAESDSGETCPDCVIQLDHIVTLGDDGDDSGALASWPTAIARDSLGRFLLTAPYGGEELPFVYDPSGTFVQRIGTVGEGPGEFLEAVYLSTSGDSLVVYDAGQGRVSVLGPDKEYIRSFSGIPHLYRWVELIDGTFVANRTDGRNPPLVRFDRNGELLGTFGDIYPDFDSSSWLRPSRYLAPSNSGGVWSVAESFDYTFREWSPEGDLTRTLELDPDWYSPYSVAHSPTPELPPQSKVYGIWEDDSGLLWVIGATAAENWAEGLGESRSVEGQQVYEVLDPSLLYDTVIEVIDTEAGGRVLYRRVVADILWSPSPGLLVTAKESDLGFYKVDIWQATLNLPGMDDQTP